MNKKQQDAAAPQIPASPPAKRLRCGIYTRKSTDEGLDQDFNSLDAQREAAEAFIKSQAHAGWVCLPERYDDPGFTGGNMERPALQRLLADIAAGRIDCVVVYKVDRLSRSLLDFARMMEVFDQRQVSFVAFTQQINTTTSMGRLMLNVLMSFAEFERAVISERTRDKIAAARRKGKWSGGHPILGYDVDPQRFKLLVNESEAARVRTIFALYLRHQALLPVVAELSQRGWRNKQWTTRKDRQRGGNTFTKSSLHKLLTNVVYTGSVRYKKEVHPGEHQGIVAPKTWQRVQDILRRQSPSASVGAANPQDGNGALLKGLVRCVACDRAMVPAHTCNGSKRYRYYTCSGAQKLGWHTCPSKAVPAGAMEEFVIEQICGLANDPTQTVSVIEQLKPPQARARLVHQLVERIDYDGAKRTVSIMFRNGDIQALAGVLAKQSKENGTCR